MNRKSFFQAILPASIVAFSAKKAAAFPQDKINTSASIVPPYLKPGDTVAITCPAGAVELTNMESCIQTLQKWGLYVIHGKTVGKRWQRFSGTDAERLQDFQELLDNPSVKAIIFGRGGYGTMRIIDQVNWTKFRQQPKWLVGYSDLTVIHLHVHQNLHIPTVHGDMSTGFSSPGGSCSSLFDVLFGRKSEYALPSSPFNRTGEATGEIIGGNLTLLNACLGSKSDIDTSGKILFIEDVSEYKYTLDRMLMSLKRSGKLGNLAGLVVGGITATKAEVETGFAMSIEELIMDKVKEYKYPVCFNFPAGHIADNRAIKMGVPFDLIVGREWVLLYESQPPVVPPEVFN